MAEDLDHQMTSAYVGIYAAVIAAESEDLDRLGEVLDNLDEVWNRLPMPYLMILSDALRGWLEVNTGAAEVRVDGHRVGRAPARLRVPAGPQRKIEISAPGYRPWVGAVSFSPDRPSEANAVPFESVS